MMIKVLTLCYLLNVVTYPFSFNVLYKSSVTHTVTANVNITISKESLQMEWHISEAFILLDLFEEEHDYYSDNPLKY